MCHPEQSEESETTPSFVFGEARQKPAFTFAEGATHVGMYNNVRHYAFTLAEVLITLAIIGIVAAMTIPTLITNYQKKMFASRLKHTYAMLANMHSMDLLANEGNRNWCGNVNKTQSDGHGDKDLVTLTAEEHIVPYLKVAKNYGLNSLAGINYPADYKCLNGDICLPSSTTGTPYYILELVNGVTLFYHLGANLDGTLAYPLIFIDVNGRAKPNVLGKDVFVVQLFDNGVIDMWNYNFSRETLLRYCSKDSSESRFCGALVKMDGWEFREDYPW